MPQVKPDVRGIVRGAVAQEMGITPGQVKDDMQVGSAWFGLVPVITASLNAVVAVSDIAKFSRLTVRELTDRIETQLAEPRDKYESATIRLP